MREIIKNNRNRMKQVFNEFANLYEQMKNQGTLSVRFPESKNEICTKIISLCNEINEGKIEWVNEFEKKEWNYLNKRFSDLLKRLLEVESENEEGSIKKLHNVIDYKSKTSYYSPVSAGDFIEWFDSDNLYDRISNLMSFYLEKFSKEEYQTYLEAFEEQRLEYSEY